MLKSCGWISVNAVFNFNFQKHFKLFQAEFKKLKWNNQGRLEKIILQSSALYCLYVWPYFQTKTTIFSFRNSNNYYLSSKCANKHIPHFGGPLTYSNAYQPICLNTRTFSIEKHFASLYIDDQVYLFRLPISCQWCSFFVVVCRLSHIFKIFAMKGISHIEAVFIIIHV